MRGTACARRPERARARRGPSVDTGAERPAPTAWQGTTGPSAATLARDPAATAAAVMASATTGSRVTAPARASTALRLGFGREGRVQSASRTTLAPRARLYAPGLCLGAGPAVDTGPARTVCMAVATAAARAVTGLGGGQDRRVMSVQRGTTELSVPRHAQAGQHSRVGAQGHARTAGQEQGSASAVTDTWVRHVNWLAPVKMVRSAMPAARV